MPPKNDVARAAIGRIIANAGPRSDHVATMLSTPVCGVDIRNDVDAARDAPLRRMAIAVGSTPHEHNGSGMPINADLATDLHPVPDKCRANVFCGINACIKPAIRKPNNIYGDISLSMNNNEFINSI